MDATRYPIGQFNMVEPVTDTQYKEAVETLRRFPKKLRLTIDQLSEEDLKKTYREGSWSVQQLIHHLADSHIHYYIRSKVALTENTPTVSTFNENDWAILADTDLRPDVSLSIIASITMRWTTFLDSLSVTDTHSKLMHPEKGALTITQIVAMAAWHCEHHFAHIQLAIK